MRIYIMLFDNQLFKQVFTANAARYIMMHNDHSVKLSYLPIIRSFKSECIICWRNFGSILFPFDDEGNY